MQMQSCVLGSICQKLEAHCARQPSQSAIPREESDSGETLSTRDRAAMLWAQGRGWRRGERGVRVKAGIGTPTGRWKGLRRRIGDGSVGSKVSAARPSPHAFARVLASSVSLRSAGDDQSSTASSLEWKSRNLTLAC